MSELQIDIEPIAEPVVETVTVKAAPKKATKKSKSPTMLKPKDATDMFKKSSLVNLISAVHHMNDDKTSFVMPSAKTAKVAPENIVDLQHMSVLDDIRASFMASKDWNKVMDECFYPYLRTTYEYLSDKERRTHFNELVGKFGINSKPAVDFSSMNRGMINYLDDWKTLNPRLFNTIFGEYFKKIVPNDKDVHLRYIQRAPSGNNMLAILNMKYDQLKSKSSQFTKACDFTLGVNQAIIEIIKTELSRQPVMATCYSRLDKMRLSPAYVYSRKMTSDDKKPLKEATAETLSYLDRFTTKKLVSVEGMSDVSAYLGISLTEPLFKTEQEVEAMVSLQNEIREVKIFVDFINRITDMNVYRAGVERLNGLVRDIIDTHGQLLSSPPSNDFTGFIYTLATIASMQQRISAGIDTVDGAISATISTLRKRGIEINVKNKKFKKAIAGMVATGCKVEDARKIADEFKDIIEDINIGTTYDPTDVEIYSKIGNIVYYKWNLHEEIKKMPKRMRIALGIEVYMEAEAIIARETKRSVNKVVLRI